MKSTFSKFFWGFIIIFLEIHLQFIDILPDPVGYLFIFLGLQSLGKRYSGGEAAKIITALLGFISIPTVFINQTGSNSMEAPMMGWWVYGEVLAIGKLIIVFFLFKMMLEIAKEHRNEALEQYTKTFSKIYIGANAGLLLAEAINTNLIMITLTPLMVIAVITFLILEIMFLILLRKYMKLDDTPPEPPVATPV